MKPSKRIGRRTKRDVLKDKNVRKDDDGQDRFEDYWTDTDTESTVFTRSKWTLRSDCSLNQVPENSVEQQLQGSYLSESNQVVVGNCSKSVHCVSGKNTSSMSKKRKVNGHDSQSVNSRSDALHHEVSKSKHKASQLSASNQEDDAHNVSICSEDGSLNRVPENSIGLQLQGSYLSESNQVVVGNCSKSVHCVSGKNTSSMSKKRKVNGHYSQSVNSRSDALHHEVSKSKHKSSQLSASNQEDDAHNVSVCSEDGSLNRVPENSIGQQLQSSYLSESNQAVVGNCSKSSHCVVSGKNTSSMSKKKKVNGHYSQSDNSSDALHHEVSKSKHKPSQLSASNQEDDAHNVSVCSEDGSLNRVPENSIGQQLQGSYLSESNQAVVGNCSKSSHCVVSGKNTSSMSKRRKVNGHYSQSVNSRSDALHHEVSKSKHKPPQLSASNQEDDAHNVSICSEDGSLNRVPENSVGQQLQDSYRSESNQAVGNCSKSGHCVVSGKNTSSMSKKRKVNGHYSQRVNSSSDAHHHEVSKSKHKSSQLSASNQEDDAYNVSIISEDDSMNQVPENSVGQQLQDSFQSESNRSAADNCSKSGPPLVSGSKTSNIREKRQVNEHNSLGINSKRDTLHHELSKSKRKALQISASNQDVCHVLDLSVNPTCPVDDLSRHYTSESSGKGSAIGRRGRKVKDVSTVCENEGTKKRGSLSERRADQAEDNVELPEKKNKKQKLPKRVKKPVVMEKAERPVRNRRPPLAHWRNERILYSYKNGEIIEVGLEEGTGEDNAAVNAIARRLEYYQQKKGKESNKKLKRQCITGSIHNIESDEIVTMQLVTPYHSVPWLKTSPTKPYRIKKMLSTEAVSFGYLELEGLETKETQFMPTEDLHFFLIQGRVQFLIQENKLEIRAKDTIIVPKCVAYSITNLENRKSLLYFSVGKFKCLESCG